MVLVGNKVDVTERVVSTEAGRERAEQMGIPFYETSAFQNHNVEKVTFCCGFICNG